MNEPEPRSLIDEIMEDAASICRDLDFRVQWMSTRRFRIVDPYTGGALEMEINPSAIFELDWGDGQAKTGFRKYSMLREIERWRSRTLEVLSERPMDVRPFRAKGDA